LIFLAAIDISDIQGDTMRSILCFFLLILGSSLLFGAATPKFASDYNSTFMHNYPPGFYGMWYYAERFYHPRKADKPVAEPYLWDKYMSRVTGLHFPFNPTPFDWEYGSRTTFNLPNYNRNIWP
jgi:hypothetical protein